MKTISKRFLKASLAMLLVVMMLFSSTITGFAAVVDNADTSANVDVADTDANVDVAESGLTIPSGSGNLVMFNNTLGWSSVHLYTKSSSLWNGNNGCTTNGATHYTMTNISGTNYWYAYMNPSNKYVLFMKDQQNNYNNIWQTAASYRDDFNSSKPYFTPSTTSNQTANSTTYYNNGEWSDTADDGPTPTEDTLIVFENTLGWSNVHLYAKSSTLWNGDNGCTTNGATYYAMENIPGTNYWYAYINPSYTSVLFMKEQQNNYNNIWNTEAAYREDYDPNKPRFTPSTTIKETRNNTKYYSDGSWSVYEEPATKYTVEFVDHDGKVLNTQEVEEGKTPTAPANPTRVGYTFAGWNPAVGAITGDTTYTATYTINTYTVRFLDINGNQIGSSQTVEHDATPTAPTPPAVTGKTFAGWNPAVGAVTANTDYQATYTDNTYSITVNQTGGTGTVNLGKTSAKYGDTVTLKVTPPTNYKISSITGGGLNIGQCESYNGSFTMPASNVTITVTYAPDVPTYPATATATTRYTSTGGSVTVNGQNSPIQLENGETATFKATPTRTFKFVGWFSDPNFTQLVSPNATYEENMTVDGIDLYALFVKDMVLYDTDTSTVVNLTYDYLTNTYSANTTAIGNNFKVSENVTGYNAIGAEKVDVLHGNIVGATIDVDAQKYILTPDLENYDPTKGIRYVITPDGDNTYTMNITLQEADKVAISVNGTKVFDKAIGTTFEYEIAAPAGQYLSGATVDPAVNFEIVDGKIEFTVPNTNVNIVPQFTNYSYVEFSNDTTGLIITGLKTGYKAGEAVSITLSPATDATTITEVTANNALAVATQNNDGSWTVTIASMPADTTITLTPTVDANFVMDYGMVAIGNYGTGVTTGFGTVSMKIGGTTLANGHYAAPTDTVTYTATESNANYTFAGFYSDAECNNVLSYNNTYTVTPTKDTTVYTLWARRQYMDFDSGTTNIVKELVYDKEDRVYTLSTVLADNSSSNAISKGAWFQVTNDMNSWTANPSYHHFGSDFSVSHNAKGFDATISWNDGGDSWKLSTSAANDTAITFILTPTGNTAIDFSAQVGEVGDLVYLSSGRLDLPGSYNAAAFEANIKFTHIEESANPDDTYVANEGENREKYKRLNLAEAQTVSFEVEITGNRAADYEVDSFVVYHIDTETYTIITPTTLGNNKYSGSVYVDGPCYIVPIYFLTEKYAADNNLAEIDIYFDATAIKDQAWGPFVACYAWGSNNAEYNGGWSGQMMIPTEDGLSFYTMITVPKATAENPPSIPNGVTFNNYMQSTVPGSNAGAFGITSTQYQCYDYREPITLYEGGYEVITFVAKDSTDGYHGDRANGVTANTVTSTTTDIFNKYDFDYLYSRDGKTPMDFNGEEIANPVDLEVGKADYYVITKGDITYDPNGTKYVGDPAYDADWAVDWYIFDSTGKYLTHILSTALWDDIDKDLDEFYTQLHAALGKTSEEVAGKTVAISYEHENNAGHQISYDGQWYGNMLDHTITADVLVGLVNADGTSYEIDTDNIADYGEGYVVDENGDKHQSLDITLDVGRAVLNAAAKEGYRFIGWHTLQPDGTYKLVSPAFDFDPYISGNTTYYAIFKQIQSGEVVINHAVYKNTDPAIPDHGGVSEMSIEVYDKNGKLVSSTPSTTRSTTSFEGTDGETYTIRVITTPLMNGQFFAWYTDSEKADETKTYEEVLTEDEHIGSTSQVYAEFEYTFDNQTSLKTINIYSDVRRVSNKANLYYKYRNRYGDIKTYTVKDYLLSDAECQGYIGNNYTAYCPTFRTLCTFITPAGEEWTEYIDQDRIQTYLDEGYHLVTADNLISNLAPRDEVTEAFGQEIKWIVSDVYLTKASSEITLVADQNDLKYTLTYDYAGNSGSMEKVPYNTLIEITAPIEYENKTFSYWWEPATGEILTYSPFYNYRIVEDKHIEAVYGENIVEDWTPSVNSVTYTREFDDNGDYIYTDFLLAYNNKEGAKVADLIAQGKDINYGYFLVRDPSVYITDSANVEYPAYEKDGTDYAEWAEGLQSVIANNKSKTITVNSKTYNCYFYNLTGKALTNFNRCSAFLRYDNTKLDKQSHLYREYAFTAIAYIVVDGQLYLSNGLGVNFFDLGNEDTTKTNN